jgi:hypothetical protein
MDHSLCSITLDSLLTLNIEEVQAHLNSVQWPNPTDFSPFAVFYQETRAIFLITATIESFLAQPLLIPDTATRSHLLALRTVLDDEHRTRLHFMSTNNESN